MKNMFLALFSVFFIAGCALTCDGQLIKAKDHMLDTAQHVYAARGIGAVTAEQSVEYKAQIEEAYTLLIDGAALCESDQEAAFRKFEEACSILEGVERQIDAAPVPNAVY